MKETDLHYKIDHMFNQSHQHQSSSGSVSAKEGDGEKGPISRLYRKKKDSPLPHVSGISIEYFLRSPANREANKLADENIIMTLSI